MRCKDVSKRDEWLKLAKSPTFQKKKQRALIKFRTADKIDTQYFLKKRWHRLRKKFYPQYSEMSLQQRAIDGSAKKYGKKIDKVSKKMAMRLKKDGQDEFAAAKAALRDKL